MPLHGAELSSDDNATPSEKGLNSEADEEAFIL